MTRSSFLNPYHFVLEVFVSSSKASLDVGYHLQRLVKHFFLEVKTSSVLVTLCSGSYFYHCCPDVGTLPVCECQRHRPWPPPVCRSAFADLLLPCHKQLALSQCYRCMSMPVKCLKHLVPLNDVCLDFEFA